MEVIPAIDLLGGSCVRLNQGDYNQKTTFNNDPVAQALSWQEQGAKRLHLVDLDGAKTGRPINDRSIRLISKSIDIPVQLGGGIRTIERAEELLEYGLDKIILGTIAIEQPEIVRNLSKKYPGRVIVGIDSNYGKVATRGWLKQSEVSAIDLVRKLATTCIDSIISTDIATDGTMKGPNLTALREVAEISSFPVIASGGIGSMADLLSILSLKQHGVIGIIVGRALYDGAIDLKEAINAMGVDTIKDQELDKKFYA